MIPDIKLLLWEAGLRALEERPEPEALPPTPEPVRVSRARLIEPFDMRWVDVADFTDEPTSPRANAFMDVEARQVTLDAVSVSRGNHTDTRVEPGWVVDPADDCEIEVCPMVEPWFDVGGVAAEADNGLQRQSPILADDRINPLIDTGRVLVDDDIEAAIEAAFAVRVR